MPTPVTETRAPEPMNGVDTPTLFATINAVGAQPELAKFTFRANGEWLSGTHSRTRFSGYFGALAEQPRRVEAVGERHHREAGPGPHQRHQHQRRGRPAPGREAQAHRQGPEQERVSQIAAAHTRP